MEVLHGIDALLYFKNGEGDWLVFGCCESFDVSISTETKSVKTVGDGTWARSRRQKLSYSVSASGIVRIDDAGTMNNFDLLEYQAQGVDIEWKAAYRENDHSTDFTYLYGTMLITSSTFSAPNDFVNGSFEAEGQGELLRGIPPSCSAAVVDYDVEQDEVVYHSYHVTIWSVTTGSVPQYHWRLNGGAINTALDSGWTFSVADYGTAGVGDHVLEIWPVCDNGIEGTKEIYNFTTTLL